ncbi:MAG TPA: hypothetical protein IAA98_05000 [Candidatus Avipropionibacterium avicola]|uniref:Uncharacterized protein n=1 Tax=Candidatus Avipropionibacterium avicola TaxID=2840701 RepID=A0A9D1GXS9_9ACTN|nr:hypothetical protein [Candidatus Avipropionibacterium avicola]
MAEAGKRRREGPPWRALVRYLLTAGGIALGLCLLAMLIGFRLNIVFLVVLAMVVSSGIWLIREVIEPGGEVSDQAPVLDVVHLQSRNADPRVRKLEEFLYGSQPRFNLASPQLQTVLAELVDDRVGEDGRGRLSEELQRYLDTTPAPPVDRRRIRLMIKEIDTL